MKHPSYHLILLAIPLAATAIFLSPSDLAGPASETASVADRNTKDLHRSGSRSSVITRQHRLAAGLTDHIEENNRSRGTAKSEESFSADEIASERQRAQLSANKRRERIEQPGMPLVYAISDMLPSEITAEEQELIESLRIGFDEQIDQAPSHDPDDPIYFDHWKTARVQADQQLRATIGWERYNRLSAIAWRTAAK